MSGTTRTRWAAIGAAVAVTLGAGGIGITQATESDGGSAYFAIEPCRVADRDMIEQEGSLLLDGWGSSGECEIPEGATALVTNVTALEATEQTNLRFYPDGDAVPETANLNPTPDTPPIPNAVTVSLNDTTGKFRIFNRFGTVKVVVDVMGYYGDHHHDDRYYTKEQVDGAVAGDRPIVTDLSYTTSDVVPSPTLDWQLMETIGTFEKQGDDTTVRLDWTAQHSHDSPTGTLYCHYQLRIDGATVDGDTSTGATAHFDGGDVVAQADVAAIATHAIFENLEAGERSVEVYVRGNADNCTLNPISLLQQLTVTEFAAAD